MNIDPGAPIIRNLSAWILLAFAVGLPHVGQAVGWIGPNGASGHKWTNPTWAGDTNTSTYAADESNVKNNKWGNPLVLTLTSAIRSDRVRVYSDFATGVDKVRVEIQLSPAHTWSNIYEGTIPNQTWQEFTFSATNIIAARYSFHYPNAAYIFWLYEFQFYVAPAQVNVPVCQTLDATSIEETTATLQGKVTNDGGMPCSYRFQIGTSVSYTTNTPWTGSLISHDYFSAQIFNGLVSNTTYHFQAQVSNSAGIGSGGDTTFVTGPPDTGWVSPTGHNDSNSVWTHEFNVYDDNLATQAKSYHEMNAPSWSSNLYLTHNTMICDGIRFYAPKPAEVIAAAVDVLRNGVWTNVFNASYADQQYVETFFPKGTTTQARIRFNLSSTTYGMDYELTEFDFHRVTDVTLSGRFDSQHRVSLAVDGVLKNTFTNLSTNLFTFNASLGAGNRILLFYDDDNIATNSGALLTRATGNDMTNLDH